MMTKPDTMTIAKYSQRNVKDSPKQISCDKATKGDHRPLRVLVIDDDPNISSAMARKLCSQGIIVISATSARQGLWRFLTKKPDAVITDLSMPEINGVEIVENIRQHKTGKHIPVIVQTGMMTDDLADRLIGIGATAVLNKPASTQEILQAMGQTSSFHAVLVERE